MPFIKDEMKKKDEAVLEDMKKEIEAAAAEQEEAEAKAEAKAETEAEMPDMPAAEAEKLKQLEAEVQEKQERVLRLQADFENFRRRTRQEKEELSNVITQNLLKDMLPLVDNFERALQAGAQDAASFQQGVEMIYKQFVAALQKNGLEVIPTEGQKFDPQFHQAVMRIQDESKEDDTIAAEMQKGYMVKGRVIRPSMVQVVSN